MLSGNDEILLKGFIEERRVLILQLQESKGIKASGVSAQLLRSEQQGDFGLLVDAAGYFEQEEFGRAGGGMPPFRRIYDWLAYQKYGLKYANEKARVGLAWAIMKKIARAGTYTHITGRPTGVLSEAIGQAQLDDFISKLAKSKATEIKTDILRLNLS